MSELNRTAVLDTLIKHETLTIDDLGKVENLGFKANPDHLKYLLLELTESGYLTILPDVTPVTYTINNKGLAEGKRLNEIA